MKAYAEYFTENGINFRCNTILQFGDSWELIGNAVLANPGSAKPISDMSNEEINDLSSFYKKYRPNCVLTERNWKVFSPDQTMGFVEKLFNGGYLEKKKELNGVIQLFNTFNIKNQHLKEAVQQIGTGSELLFSIGVERHFNDKPTYFGFSNDILNDKTLREVAKNIFLSSTSEVKRIYQPDFEKNSFYHPMYVNRAYKQGHFEKYKNSVLIPLIESA